MNNVEPLTRNDFLESGWEAEIEGIDQFYPFAYSSAFYSSAGKASDEKKAEVLTLLAMLMTGPLRLDEREGPLASANGFSDRHLDFFEEILNDISDNQIAARAADLLWTKRRNYKMAEVAIDRYLECTHTVDLRKWTYTQQSIERALQLASSINKTGDQYKSVIERITNILDVYGADDPLFLSARLMRLLYERPKGEGKDYSELSEKLALRAEAENAFDRAREYWSAKVSWHLVNKDEGLSNDAKTKYAASYEKESEFNLNNRLPKFLRASYPLEQAIIAYRGVPNSAKKVEEIKLKLLEYQGHAVKEIPQIKGESFDITDIYLFAENMVRDKPFDEALKILVANLEPHDLSKIREQVEKNRETYKFAALFSRVMVNANGRVTARQPDDDEGSLFAEMCEWLGHTYSLRVKGIIEPARQMILAQHPVRISDFSTLLQNHPFIPEGREYIIAQGLYSGFVGDFMTALHLLVPQMEESIRFLLIRMGIVPSSFTDKGIQDEYNLNKLLKESKFTTELHKVFGENLIFELRCILIERFGSNLRNEMAHGLLDHISFYSYASRYFWGICLRFWLLPYFLVTEEVQTEISSETAAKVD